MTRDQLTHALELLHQQRTRPHAERHGRSSADAAKSVTGGDQTMTLQRRRMRQVEDRLIAAVLDEHPNATWGLDRLLHDIGTQGSVPDPANRRATGHPADSQLIEQRLLGLILDRHPRRKAAIERLLTDLGQAAPARESHRDQANEYEQEDPERWSGLE